MHMELQLTIIFKFHKYGRKITMEGNMHIHLYMSMHTYIHTYIHEHIHTYIHTFIHTYIHTHIFNFNSVQKCYIFISDCWWK